MIAQFPPPPSAIPATAPTPRCMAAVPDLLACRRASQQRTAFFLLKTCADTKKNRKEHMNVKKKKKDFFPIFAGFPMCSHYVPLKFPKFPMCSPSCSPQHLTFIPYAFGKCCPPFTRVL